MLNLALNKPARQSSTSAWSGSQAPEEDARGGNDGIITSEMGFHTAEEWQPWWQVDLEDVFVIRRVVLFNRQHQAQRLRRFSLLKSLNGRSWLPFFRKLDDVVFGAVDGAPYVAEIAGDHLARFVRVRLDGYNCLHFSECQVFGEQCAPELREFALQEDARMEVERYALPPGRTGRMLDIGGFTVFVDTERYHPAIVSMIDSGEYEVRERELTARWLHPGARVIEVGTAIGLVTMTAASVAGPENVLTFDANPYIVADARENFRRNALLGIKSRVGVLKNRSAISAPNETASFHIATAFWASRLDASPADPGINETIQVPVSCLEDEVQAHNADVLICDIEGGEVELLTCANLDGICTIIMETHYWAVGEAATDKMIRKLITDGFAIHLGHSGGHIVVLRR